MGITKKHRLIEIEYPEFGLCEPPLTADIKEFEDRIRKIREKMEKQKLTHLVVYADREHFANLAYITNFDPRFEEALLIMNLKDTPLILVGNENVGRLPVSPLYNSGKLRYELYQTFSLLSQPRDNSRQLKDILSDELNIQHSSFNIQHSKVGCVGWKYFSGKEFSDFQNAVDIPSYIADILRSIAGFKNVVNATDIFMHPGTGLRSFCSASEIAFFEYSNIIASEGMKNVMFGIKDGISDLELAKMFEYNGMPLNCHITMQCGDNKAVGMTGPTGAIIKRGDPFSSNIGYWGSNICRAGWAAESKNDLPVNVQDYIENFAGRYFEVMGEWFSMLKIGTKGAGFYKLIAEKLPIEKFGIFLNPGHLIHLDEWLSSPIYKGSDDELHSGMYMQVDVIPSSDVYYSTRMEDGVVIADKSLQKEIKEKYPDCYSRCMKRREFMINTLGIDLPEEILPLSNIPAIVPPFLLNSNLIFALES